MRLNVMMTMWCISWILIITCLARNVAYSYRFPLPFTQGIKDGRLEIAMRTSPSLLAHLSTPSTTITTLQDLENHAIHACNITLRPTVTGPFLRLEAYAPGYAGFSPVLVGYLTAFLRPGSLLHLDTIQVKNRRQVKHFHRAGWTVDGPGISFLMGAWATLWAYEKGCKTAQLLAVYDSEHMHRVLCRLYESFGFTTIREVGDDWTSIADRLVWGARGTLMEADLATCLSLLKSIPKHEDVAKSTESNRSD